MRSCYAYRCYVCAVMPEWSLERVGDAVCTWACGAHLQTAMREMQRPWEISEIHVHPFERRTKVYKRDDGKWISGFSEETLYWPCPVDGCDWKFKAEPVDRERYVIKDPTPKGVADAVADAYRRRAAEIDQELRTHLESHDVLDFVRTIARLKQDLAQQDSGIRPHVYRSQPPAP